MSLYKLGGAMIIEISFCLVGGINFGLERSWEKVMDLLKKYPRARWKKEIDKKGNGKYLVSIN
jgi:hypothetical protein